MWEEILMKKRRVLVFTLGGILVLSLVGCGKTSTDSTETAFEAYYQAVSDDDIIFEREACFVDSQVLLTAAEGVTQKQIEKLVKKQDGTVVGYISISNDYQIEFSDGKTYEELDAIISDWENNDKVEAASLNYASQIRTDSIAYTNDPWIDAENASDTSGFVWSETTPEGNNWWAEAIMMPSVWNMDMEFKPVKVGIYDTMFDVENEDLDKAFVKLWNNPENKEGSCMVSSLYGSAERAGRGTSEFFHGTHVAGLIAAEAAKEEKGFGIAGVSQNAQLYGFAYKSTPTNTEDVSRWNELFELKYSIALMLNEGVKVINISVNDDEMLVAAQHGVEKALTILSEWSTSYEYFFRKCLDAGYDFLIVKCAGNENGYDWTTCSVTDDHPYGYMIDNNVTDDTVYDAQYDILGAIKDNTVAKHILIVGAAENHTEYYTTAHFSNVGNRVDVYAPGVNILSDLPTNITGMKEGTSMATPIVSGVAALIWGANPDLSAVQVASIIRASTSVTMFDSESVSNIFKTVETTPIVNAYFAVQLALNTSGEGDDAASTAGIITGMAYTTEADGSLTALSDASVTVEDSEGNTVETAVTSDSCGYTFVLPAGVYTITVELEGYETASKEVSLAEGDVLDVDFEFQLVSNYTWVVEPTIEADDIYYLADYPDMDYPVNVLSKQANNPNAVIQRGEELGIINLEGKLLTEVAYKEIANFGDSYMMIRTVPKYSEEYDKDWDIYWLNKDGEVSASVGNGELDTTVYYYYKGIRQRTGNIYSDVVQEVIPVQESSVYHLQNLGLIMNSLSGKYALEYDCNLITDFIYDECGSESDGLFAVCQNGKWGYVDEQGQVIIPIEYDASWKQYPVFDLGSRRSSSKVKEYCYAASGGYVVLCQDGEWEMKDTEGNQVIAKGVFDAIRPVFDGKCWVKKDGKWGVIQVKDFNQEEGESLDDWKKAYLDLLEKVKKESSELYDADTYALMNLNGDFIPELYVDNYYSYENSELYCYVNGTLMCQQMSSGGLHYIEGENLFVDYKADANGEYAHFYAIDDNGFILVGENSDKVGFDWSRAKNIYSEASYSNDCHRYIGEGLYGYDEIIDVIRRY